MVLVFVLTVPVAIVVKVKVLVQIYQTKCILNKLECNDCSKYGVNLNQEIIYVTWRCFKHLKADNFRYKR